MNFHPLVGATPPSGAWEISITTYLDRVCIGSAAPLMRRDLGLTALQMGAVFSAFSLAYGIFEIPGG